MTDATRRRGRSTARTKGRDLIEGLSELADVLKAGEPLESRFTVRTFRSGSPRCRITAARTCAGFASCCR